MTKLQKQYLSDIIMDAQENHILHILEPIIRKHERVYRKVKGSEYFEFVERIKAEYKRYKTKNQDYCAPDGVNYW